MSPRIIIHVDLDAFFASVEEQKHPEYKGRPVVVGADPKDGKGRGVVSTSNYEARKFGVHSAMPISRAWNLCKDAIFLPVNYKLYMKVSRSVMKILKPYADKFEQTGIDEAFLDVSDRAGDFNNAEKIAKKLKEAILKKEGLTCSVGIAPNKLVAKIASDFQKPDGLTSVEETTVTTFLAPMQVDKIWGIGKKTKDRMNAIGITTIGELAAYDPARLEDEFGALGLRFNQMAQGIDYSQVIEEWIPRSFSRERTFEIDIKDRTLIHDNLNKLLEQLFHHLKKRRYDFRTLSIKIRYANFDTYTRSTTLRSSVAESKALKVAYELIDPFLQNERAIRLIGVRASNLVKSGEKEMLLDELVGI